jgi:heat-inducible transcriptional repressor
MQAEHTLDARKQRILWAVIREHILSAGPVGSEALCERQRIDVSPATIRNEMHALTEMEYLRQPHTSAGRVPTDRAYRLYVDTMLGRRRRGVSRPGGPRASALREAGDVPIQGQLTTAERERIRRRLQHADEVERAVEEAARTLASVSEYPAVASTPPPGRLRIRHIHLVPASHDRALVVILTDAGPVEGTILRLKRETTPEELDELSRILTSWLAGRTLQDITGARLEQLVAHASHQRALVHDLGVVLARQMGEHVGRVVVEGVAHILKQPEFRDVRRAQPVLSALDREEMLRSVLRPETGDVEVTIGHENPLDEMHDCSIVSATYWVRGEPVGVIGVVGPTRMPYARMITVVRYLARTLSESLSRAG